MSTNNMEAPAMLVPASSSVAAVFAMVAAFFTALGSPPFGVAVVIFLAVAVVLLVSVKHWVDYFHKYVDYRIRQVMSNPAEQRDT